MNKTTLTQSRPTRRMLRFGLYAIGIFISVLLAVLVILAQGGAEPLVWKPEPTPQISASGEGEFTISVSPTRASADFPVRILVGGFTPGAEVMLTAATEDARNKTFESWARFTADDKGEVNLARTPSEAGTYTGVEGNGLLWSMRSEDMSLFVTSTGWDEREYRLQVVSDGRMTKSSFTRVYPFSSIKRESVGGKRWVGELTLPIDGGPHPVVIFLAGFGDGPAPVNSAFIASRGFAVLNIGYHGWEGVQDELIEVPIESVTDAIDWLETRSDVMASKVGIYGISKGAELGLLAASRDPRIVATAAIVPSSHAFSGASFKSVLPQSSWTWEDQAIPFARPRLNRGTLRVLAQLMLGRPTAFRPSYETALEAPAQDSAIDITQIMGEILLAAGEKDQIWPSASMTRFMRKKIGSDRLDVLIFPDAGHGLNPNLWPVGDFSEDGFLIRGGTPEANHLAGQVVWRQALEMFERQLLNQVESAP